MSLTELFRYHPRERRVRTLNDRALASPSDVLAERTRILSWGIEFWHLFLPPELRRAVVMDGSAGITVAIETGMLCGKRWNEQGIERNVGERLEPMVRA